MLLGGRHEPQRPAEPDREHERAEHGREPVRRAAGGRCGQPAGGAERPQQRAGHRGGDPDQHRGQERHRDDEREHGADRDPGRVVAAGLGRDHAQRHAAGERDDAEQQPRHARAAALDRGLGQRLAGPHPAGPHAAHPGGDDRDQQRRGDRDDRRQPGHPQGEVGRHHAAVDELVAQPPRRRQPRDDPGGAGEQPERGGLPDDHPADLPRGGAIARSSAMSRCRCRTDSPTVPAMTSTRSAARIPPNTPRPAISELPRRRPRRATRRCRGRRRCTPAGTPRQPSAGGSTRRTAAATAATDAPGRGSADHLAARAPAVNKVGAAAGGPAATGDRAGAEPPSSAISLAHRAEPPVDRPRSGRHRPAPARPRAGTASARPPPTGAADRDRGRRTGAPGPAPGRR